MSDSLLPPLLQYRIDRLPVKLQDHIDRVRGIARELAEVHSIDSKLADVTAAAHDVARHVSGRELVEEAIRIGLPVTPLEQSAPVLLHGPVGAAWLAECREIVDPVILDAVRWHTTAHPALAPIGQIVFIADKLDPYKSQTYPFQATVREAALRSLDEGTLVFLDELLRQQLDRGRLIHPMCSETRNVLLIAALSC